MTRHTANASRTAARFFAVGLLAAGLGGFPAHAQDKSDPVVAKIGPDSIRLSELTAAAETLPPQARQMPREQLLPRLLEQIVDTRVLAIEARKTNLDKDPVVQRVLRDVQERALVSALLEKEVAPHVTDEAVKARFDKEIGNQPPVQELHARHILVEDEATAKKIIAELKKGADFAALSKQYSKDAAAVEQGGDLGYFKPTDMVAEFSTAAFALKDKDNELESVRDEHRTQIDELMTEIERLTRKNKKPFKAAELRWLIDGHTNVLDEHRTAILEVREAVDQNKETLSAAQREMLATLDRHDGLISKAFGCIDNHSDSIYKQQQSIDNLWLYVQGIAAHINTGGTPDGNQD